MFSCFFCDYKTTEFKESLKHREYHKYVTTNFYCGFEGCGKFFELEVTLRIHLIRNHNLHCKSQIQQEFVVSNVVNAGAKYVCTLEMCKKELDNYASLIKHLKSHINDYFNVKCPYINCDKKYDSVNSFTGHLSKKHRTIPREASLLFENEELYNPIQDSNDVQMQAENQTDNHELDNYEFNNLNMSSTSDDCSELYILNVAQFYLKLECQYMIPASTIQCIVSGEFSNHKLGQENLKSRLQRRLLEEELSFDVVKKIERNVFENDLFLKSQTLFGTDHKRKKFYKNKFNYVEPQSIFLGTIDGKKRYFHYVPIEETIKNIFRDKSVTKDLFVHSESSESSLLKDFNDGTILKNNKFVKENSKILKLALYQDSFDLVCPIGPAKKIHKVLAVYLSFLDLPDYLRTHINNIKLVALCKEKYFNHHKVYGTIVQTLKIIETDGVQIQIGQTIKGILVFIIGDNLGSHSLGGYLENFSTSIHFCRYCLITRSEFHANDGCFQTYPVRSIESYNKALDAIKQNNLKSYEGLKFNSVFNELKAYHVCNPGLPPCLGHDLFEGVVAYDAKLFIDNLVGKKWFTISTLNNRIASFSYSTDDTKDKPCLVEDKSNRISGGACQVWQFLRLFPLIMQDYIEDPFDQVWMLVLQITEIVEIVSAPAIHKSRLPYLQIIINEYLSVRQALFDEKLRPKHHYLHHYPDLIRIFGPLIKVWSMRFESKHTFFKRAIRTLHNFINVTKSLSEKHELFQSFIRSGGDLRLEVQIHESSRFSLQIYTEELQAAVRKVNLPSRIEECNKVTVKGTTYNKGDGLCVQQFGYQYGIQIGQICLILIDDERRVFVVLQILETLFRPNSRVYELGRVVKYQCLPLDQMISYEPLHSYNVGHFSCFKPKYGFVAHGL